MFYIIIRVTENWNMLRYFSYLLVHHVQLPTYCLLQILFLGCGDLRNTFETVNTKGAYSFHFHLNDRHPLILSRNITILKIVSSPDFDPNNQEDLNFIWDVWYNTDWPDKTRKRFIKVLKDLLAGKLPDNITVPEIDDLKCFKEIWTNWFLTSTKTMSDSEKLMRTVQKKR